MAKKNRERESGQAQQTVKEIKRTGPHGKQAHEFAERANMKRQQKKMHLQDHK